VRCVCFVAVDLVSSDFRTARQKNGFEIWLTGIFLGGSLTVGFLVHCQLYHVVLSVHQLVDCGKEKC